MNNKDRKEIAKIWAAGILLATDTYSFEALNDISEKDQDKIVEEVHDIAHKILANRPQLHTLNDILDHVLGPLE